MSRLLLLPLLVLALLLSACSRHLGRPDAPPGVRYDTGWTVQRDLVYSPPGWPEALRADLYLPDPGPRSVIVPAQTWPAVLLVHGGGWEGPDRRAQMASIAERLASRGYVVMNASYRFAPQYLWPAPLLDLQEALKWLRAQAGTQPLRPNHIAAFGYSAGGHLAALLGALGESPETRVQAVVAGGAPSDLAKYDGGRLVPQFLGARREEQPARYAEASPVSRIRAGQAPVFLYHGGADVLVPPDHAEDYRAALTAAGVRNELFLLRGRGHISAFFSDGPAVAAAIDFLDRELR